MLISVSAEYLVSLGYPHRSKQLTSLKDSLSSVLNHQLKIWTVISTTRSLHRIYLPHCSSIMGNIFIQHALVPPTFHFLVFLVAGIKLSWNKTFHISLWMRWSTEFYQLSLGKGWFLLQNKGVIPSLHFCLWKCNYNTHPSAYPTASF